MPLELPVDATLYQLRLRISEVFNVPQDSFNVVLCRGAKLVAQSERLTRQGVHFNDQIMMDIVPRVFVGGDFGSVFVAGWNYVINVVAGTGFSGIAFGVNTEHFSVKNIIAESQWPGRELAGIDYAKAVTMLFYSNRLDANGNAADRAPRTGWLAQHEARTSNAITHAWQVQTRFKLRLACSQDPNIPPLPPGMSHIDVISDYLKAMRVQVTKRIHDGQPELDPRFFKWCITVPAQWSQRARSDMHRAAVLAGIVRDVDGRDNGGSMLPLNIVTECDAAAAWAINRAVDPVVHARLFDQGCDCLCDHLTCIARMRGAKFLLVDIGVFCRRNLAVLDTYIWYFRQRHY